MQYFPIIHTIICPFSWFLMLKSDFRLFYFFSILGTEEQPFYLFPKQIYQIFKHLNLRWYLHYWSPELSIWSFLFTKSPFKHQQIITIFAVYLEHPLNIDYLYWWGMKVKIWQSLTIDNHWSPILILLWDKFQKLLFLFFSGDSKRNRRQLQHTYKSIFSSACQLCR